MQNRGDETPRITPSESALRSIMRRLRDIMGEEDDGQTRLNKIVRQIAGVMVAEVCSIYLRRNDGSLELFATEGLNLDAVHTTRLHRGEGLVGRCVELAVPINEPDATSHPAYSYRPETGEEVYHSFLAVPIQRGGQVLGVLVVQNKTSRDYTDEDIEVLQSTAMVVAEHLVSGAVDNAGGALELDKSLPASCNCERISDGIALGHIVLHEPRIVVTKLMADDSVAELRQLEEAIEKLRKSLDEMFSHEHLSGAGAHREVLEAYRMFAHDRGWERRLRESVENGLTAQAAVERVQNATRARLLRHPDPYWHERTRDLDDLSDRLLRILFGHEPGSAAPSDMWPDTVLIARTMGPAELLDYDRTKLRGLILEDGSGQSHVGIVAKALGIAAVGQATGMIERVAAGDPVIVDAETGLIHLRPTSEVIGVYSDKVRFRARKHRKYVALRDKPAITKDGQPISLQINAGLLVDLPQLNESGADGIGLFRTELQLMLSSKFPRLTQQVDAYREIVREAGDKPVVFRALDIGGDKILPSMRSMEEANPALGWRAIRMSIDRPALLRMQIRAFLRATAGRELRMLVPMVTTADEIDTIRALLDRELELHRAKSIPTPSSVLVGAMLEVPSLLFELDDFFSRVDFVSVGSNDLLQFLFAADRQNARVSCRYDPLSIASLRALGSIIKAAQHHDVPLTVCGEMAGRPLEAMTLIALGVRAISMAPASIGPVKAMILSLDAARAEAMLSEVMQSGTGSLRADLEAFAENEGIELP